MLCILLKTHAHTKRWRWRQMPKENSNKKPIQVPEDVELGTEFNIREVNRDQQKHKRKHNVTLDPRENRFNQ